MHTLRFFPEGNADTCLIELENERIIVYDYANMADPDDKSDKRIDLAPEIKRAAGDNRFVDVLAFSHLDKDHFNRATELFWLEHAEKYQSDDRIKAGTVWVPAAAIIEPGITDEGRVLRQEARHRLKKGKGIRVFSSPGALNDWLKDEGIDPKDRAHLITIAGELAPEFTLESDGVEFFVHSPFAEHGDTGVRNDGALFMQATFEVEKRKTRLILAADCGYEVLEAIIRLTKAHSNEERLIADINNIPHHCSYLSLAEEKGDDETKPSTAIKWYYEEMSASGVLFVSTSDRIPAGDTTQPPHKQAANYYKRVARNCAGEFLVTMEHPTALAPKPMVIEITGRGHKRRKPVPAASISVASERAGRAG